MLKILAQAIAHQKTHAQPKGEKKHFRPRKIAELPSLSKK